VSRPLTRRFRVDGEVRRVEWRTRGDATVVLVDGDEYPFDARLARALPGGAEVHLAGSGRAVVVRDGDRVHVALGGRQWVLEAATERRAAETHAIDEDEPFAASPMTGVVLAMHAVAGAAIAEGGPLFVIEAMKMEFAVAAPRDVVVEDVLGAVGDRVEIGAVLVTFREESP
jgi:acetyl/propionyl-CoA carboxylase alpha subunit